MESDLRALEQKLTQFVEMCRRLREDNHQLRQQLATAIHDNQALNEKIGTATSRLESLLSQIPEEEA